MQKNVRFLITAVIDILMVFFAYASALALRDSELVVQNIGKIRPEDHLGIFLLSAALLLCLFLYHGLYKGRQMSAVREVMLLGRVHGKWLVILMAVAYLSKYDFSRFILVIFVLLSFLFFIAGRFVARTFNEFLLYKDIGLVSVIIIGKGKKARDLEKELGHYYGARMKLLGILQPVLTEEGMVIPKDELISKISNHTFVQVYIAEPQLSHENILSTMAACSLPQVEFKVVADVFTLATGSFDITNIDAIPTLEIRKARPSFVYRFIKRVLDIVGSIVGIIVTTPIWLFIAICIKMETHGPALISQRRVGLGGKEFTMWKFRTMYADSKLYDHTPQDKSDKRITSVGAILRKLSLDELPQLLNVLIGNMSIVGPRPEMAFIVKDYTDWQRKRLEAKPGITGLWQVLGRKDIPLTENIQYDFYYINNQSLLLDFIIILKTIPVVILGKGAY